MSRKRSLTPEVQTILCDLTRKGTFVNAAAVKAGIDRSCVYNWLERGEADPAAPEDDAFVAFAQAFREAEAEFECWALDQILSKEKGWQAIAWILERRWPDRYSARALISHEHSGKVRHEHKHTIDAASLNERIAALAARFAPDAGQQHASESAGGDVDGGAPSIIN